MLSLKDLKKAAAKEGVPQAVVEKDYVLSVALKAISESLLARHAIFKGGTAIRKAYFTKARFSEDLDFNAVNAGKNECLELLKGALEGKTLGGISFEKVVEEKTNAGLKASIKYLGQLAYAQRIKFDFNFRENMVDQPIDCELPDAYGLGRAKLLVMGLEEIFAEKIHALCSRSAARDLYDAWFLFEKGVQIDKLVLDQKFAYYGEKFDAVTAMDNVRKTREVWQKDLRHLLKKLPEFDEIEREVGKKLDALK